MADKSFDEVLDAAAVRGANVVPGCILYAVDGDGEYFYKRAAGYTSILPDAAPITEEATLWIASCTKLITAICALQFVEQGTITLDESVKKHLPELANLEVIEWDRSNQRGFSLRPCTSDITLRQLLTHSSGVTTPSTSPLLQAWRRAVGPLAPELSGTVIGENSTPLMFDPGEGWTYGASFNWVGLLVRRLSGKTLGAYMQEKIFDSLGMTCTTFELDHRPDIKSRLVDCARRQADGGLVQYGEPLWPGTVKEHLGSGGLWSTVPDFMKVLADLVRPEPTLLTRTTVEDLLFHPQLAPGSRAVTALAEARSATSSNTLTADLGINYSCGGLVFTEDSEQAGLPKNTLTWGGLPNIKWFINRDYGVAAMFATQVMPPGDARCAHLTSEYFQEILRTAKERKKRTHRSERG